MSEALPKRPAVTIAAVVERDGAYLMVRERTDRGILLNQPAGHLECGESLAEGAVRETLEETAWQVEPYALVGVYRWVAPDNGDTFVRFAFAARPITHFGARALDADIVAAAWFGYEEIVARRREHRSPLVLRSIDDYRAGLRWPVDLVRELRPETGDLA